MHRVVLTLGLGILAAATASPTRADVRVPTPPLEDRARDADKVFVGVLVNRTALPGDWCHAELKVTKAIKGVKVGDLVPVLWRPEVARYDARTDQVGLALLKYQHNGRYWLRSDTFEGAELSENAVEALKTP